MTVAEHAEALYGRIRTCTLCQLSETRTNAVPGEGPLDAEVLLIGEAPGMNEDKQGRPFVGAAGQFLEELLAAAGMQRSEVYICNVLKCRPPGNRDPLPTEIASCKDYLDEQIDLIDGPVLLDVLDREPAMTRFLQERGFTPERAFTRMAFATTAPLALGTPLRVIAGPELG